MRFHRGIYGYIKAVYREDARLPEAAVGGRVEEAFGFRQDYFTQVRQTGLKLFCP